MKGCFVSMVLLYKLQKEPIKCFSIPIGAMKCINFLKTLIISNSSNV